MSLFKLQGDIGFWCWETLGVTTIRERTIRFLEEAIELAQALNITEEEVVKLVRYVFARPAGEVDQEIGGTLVTLLALADRVNIDAGYALNVEFARIQRPSVREKIKARQAEKRASGVTDT